MIPPLAAQVAGNCCNILLALLCWLSLAAPVAHAQELLPEASHTIQFHEYAGLPAVLTVTTSENRLPSAVRALLVIDGFALAVPLQYSKLSGAFRGTFPTPQKALVYSFQMTFPDGQTVLTREFRAAIECEPETLRKELLLQATAFPGQQSLLREAFEEEKIAEQILHVESMIRYFRGAP